jgi:acyl transferase domain-containing protein
LQTEEGEKYYQELVKQHGEIPVNYARVGFLAESVTQAKEFLQICIDWLKNKPELASWEHPQGIFYRQQGIETSGKVVALFSGQGSQYLEMGRELVINFPCLRQMYADMDSLFSQDGLKPVSEVVFPPPVFDVLQKANQLESLQLTEYAQPAIGVFSASLYKILQQAGFAANFVAGHSFGELTALWAAGVLSEEDYLFLVKARGQAMATPVDTSEFGGMLAVRGDIRQVEELIKSYPEVRIANYNSQHQVVLAGKKTDITQVQDVLKAKGCFTVLLGVSAAFHTPLVGYAQKPFAAAIEKVNFQAAKIPVYTNVTGDRYPDTIPEMRKLLQQHLLNQVQFQREIENIYNAGGYCFVEFGPKAVLTNLVKEILGDKPHIAIALNESQGKNSDRLLREAVVQLQVVGLPLQNLDPYQISPPVPAAVPKHKQLNMRINSTNLDEKTQQAFAKALENGHKINSQPVTTPTETVREIEKAEVEKLNQHNGNSGTVNNSKIEKIEITAANYQRIIDNLENSINELSRQQHEILQVHEQSLQNQAEYTKTFYQLMQQQHSLLGNGEVTEYQAQTQQIAITSSERNMMRFHDHQADTIRIHEKYLNYQQECSNNYFQLLQQHYNFLLAENSVNTSPGYRNLSYNISTQSNSEIEVISPELVEKNFEESSHTSTITVVPKKTINIDITTLSQTLLSVVSDKTGYPVEMLDLSMDMEVDLGIDSIKRVEILGGLLELYPDLPQPNPEELGQLRTLGQIAEYIQTLLPNLTTNQKAEIITEVKQPVVEVAKNPPLETAVSDIQNIPSDLSQIFLNIVSDKTGYPVEMLDLSMDIEADLGIDSIKRVEILGGLLELYPDLPKPNSEELGQLRTLAEIVNYMQQKEVNIPHLLTEAKPELNPPIFCVPVKLKQLPEPDFLQFTPAENSVAVITDDGSFISEKLAINLTQKGWKTVVLSFPSLQSTLADNINRVVLTDWQEETLQQQLANITRNYGRIAIFIHLQPKIDDDNSLKIRYLEIEKTLLRHVFLIAKHLKPSLNEAATKTRACFLAVTHLDGELGLGNTNNFPVISSGLFGLTKTLNQEWENVFCRSLDLSPDLDNETAVNCILAEIHDPNLLITEVGYSSKGRVTLIANSTSLPTPNLINSITPNQVFLVSGGAKGITAQCVIKLAQEYKCKFILLGRSSTEAEPIWTKNCQDEAQLKQRIMEDFLTRGEKPTPIMVQKQYQAISSQREIQTTLKAIEQAGGQAEYISVDVSDGVSLTEKLASVVARLGEITGVIHGAGNLADKRIEKKTIQDFETVYLPKVKGLENLLDCVSPQQLKYLILFSSVTGFYGNIGQSDYAIANEILNKSAHLFKHHHPHCHVVSINWGPWDSGMVSPELKKAFTERQIATISVENGTQMLVNQLALANQDTVQLVIGSHLNNTSYTLSSELKTYHIYRKLTLTANPFLQDHVIANRPVLPATCGLTWMTNLSEQIYPGYKTFRASNFKVLKGIIFDENLANEYLLELQETAKIDNKEIEMKAKISSQTPDGKIRYHFTTNLLLKRENTTPPKYENINLTQNQELLITNQELYQNGTSSLFHGKTFQGVTSILNNSPQYLNIECKLPQVTDKQQGQYQVQTFNPYIADVQAHVLWIWTQKYMQNGCLPSEIKTFEQFKPVPFNETFYVTCEIKSQTETNVVADIITYNQQGEIYNRMINAKGTLLPK